MGVIKGEKQLLKTVELINKKLLDRAIKTPNGLSWESMGMGGESKVIYEVSESIYCGVGGIALYFLRQYKALGNQEHLAIAKEALKFCRWFIKNNEQGADAYLTGRMGVALTMLEFHELEPDKELLKEAIELAHKSSEIRFSEYEVCDYINGIAGRIHGLIHIHNLSQDESIVPLIDKLSRDLLEKSWLHKNGIYWDRSGQQICGLCGLSHGAGGIGYVFMELANYFDNPALNLVGRLAMDYEDQYFNNKTGNWPDLRRGSFTPDELEKNKNEFKNGNHAHFERHNDMNAWCHGAAGIGLVRLEAYKNLGDKKFLKDAKYALAKTKITDLDDTMLKPNYTLCHGGGGNAELFIRAFELTGDKRQLSNARKIADMALRFYEIEGYFGSGYASGGRNEDVSLFMGNAGVGYFILRALYPEKMPSLLIPSLSKGKYGKSLKNFNFLAADESECKRIILNRYFSQTIAIANDKSIFKGEKLYKDFVKNVQALIKSTGSKELRRAFRTEKKMFEFDLNAPSHALLAIKQIVQSEVPATTVKPAAKYELDPDVLLLSGSENYSMVSRHSRGMQEDQIPMFTFKVLKAFTKPTKAAIVTEEISSMFGELSAEEKKEVYAAIENQIEEALNSGKLREVTR